jgi:hypothetical protein
METRGCLMDFCDNLEDFNAMLARRYQLCDEECRPKLEKSPLKDPIAKILIELRREENYSKSVLIIGSYHGKNDTRLQDIKGKLNNLGYQAFLVKDIPSQLHGSLMQKFVNLASQSHFIVCENSFASGHIDELRKCVEDEFITCILQKTNRKATSLQLHFPYYHTFIETFCCGNSSNVNRYVCRHKAPNLDKAIESAIEWAEDHFRKRCEILSKIYPHQTLEHTSDFTIFPNSLTTI